MSLPEKGETPESIFTRLDSFKTGDLKWRSGKILAYVYDAGPEVEAVVNRAYTSYLTESGLDPTTYPSALKLETEVVRAVADLVRGDAAVAGNFTSGGTESIICAMKAARDWARVHKPHIKEPEMVMSLSVHCAFHKAAAYLGIKPVVTDFDPETFRARPDLMREAINENTIILIGSAPSYAQGVVDPIPEIAALALEKGLLCHVDGCVGGIMLSVLRRMGRYGGPDFDFSVPGVTSMSADLHKFGYCAKGASVVLYRNKDLRWHQIFASAASTSYALVNNTVLSSKSAGPIAAAWAVLHFLGEEGYRRIYGRVMDATAKLIDGINAIEGLRVLGKPDLCLFSFVSDTLPLFQLSDIMRKRGWFIQPQFSTDISPANLHVTVNNSTVAVADELLKDLRECMEELKAEPKKLDPVVIKAQVRKMLESMSPEALGQMAAMAGVQGNDLPSDMAMVNMILDALPDELTERMLVQFMNDMYV